MSNINFYNTILGIEYFYFNINHLVHLYVEESGGQFGLGFWFDVELHPDYQESASRKSGHVVWFDTEAERTRAIKRVGGVRARVQPGGP